MFQKLKVPLPFTWEIYGAWAGGLTMSVPASHSMCEHGCSMSEHLPLRCRMLPPSLSQHLLFGRCGLPS